MPLPNVFPTGTTVYKPEKAWGGYTVMPLAGIGTVIIDMNGRVVKVWHRFQGIPSKLLPGGHVMGSLNNRPSEYAYQDAEDLTQLDWEGNIEWSFAHLELVDDFGTPHWVARQHHDYQREGNPVGYYVPGMEARVDGGKTLLLCHRNTINHRISDKMLLDDCFVEVEWDGAISWQWNAADHFSELGFSEAEKNLLFRNPNMQEVRGGQGDWLHINAMSLVGPNRWYDAGDERFNPANIIWDAREANILAITSRETGKIVWKMGPDFTATKELRRIGQIIGQHHCHIIPQGLPGAGNVLVFDNGGWAGYGLPSRTSRRGNKADRREYSRVLEINPVTLELVWEFTGAEFGGMNPMVANANFFSPLISSAQRLPNGNTLITEGCFNRLLEVTPAKELVWEYIVPFPMKAPHVYRAYRYPYDYIPQLPRPVERPVTPPDRTTFRVDGADEGMIHEVTSVVGVRDEVAEVAPCVTDNA